MTDLFNHTAEQALLGSMLIDPHIIPTINQIIKPNSFYIERHSMIYTAMLRTYEQHESCDIVLLCDQLEKENLLEEVGGSAEITALINQCPTSIHAEHYANIILDLHSRRELVEQAGKMAQSLFQQGENYESKIKEIITSLETTLRNRISQLSVTNAQNLVENNPPTEWLWPNYIPYHELSSIGGREGTGKSAIIQDWIRRMLNGYEMPDGQRPNIKSNNILFIDAEDYMTGWIDRVRDWQNCSDPNFWRRRDGLEIIKYPEKNILDFASEEHQQALVNIVYKVKPFWIILDSWQASLLKSTYDEQIAYVVQFFKRLVKEFNCALTTTMHMNKETRDAYEKPDSSGIKGAGATAYRFRATFAAYRFQLGSKRDLENDPRIIEGLRISSAKHPAKLACTFEPLHPAGFFVKYHDPDSLWSIQEDETEMEEMTTNSERIQTAILELLTRIGSASNKRLSEELNIPAGQISRATQELAEKGEIFKTGRQKPWQISPTDSLIH